MHRPVLVCSPLKKKSVDELDRNCCQPFQTIATTKKTYNGERLVAKNDKNLCEAFKKRSTKQNLKDGCRKKSIQHIAKAKLETNYRQIKMNAK